MEWEDYPSFFRDGFREDTAETLYKQIKGIPKDFFHHYHILYAAYRLEGYEGLAYILLLEKLTDKLFLMTMGHCSYYGLEWQKGETLEETSIPALLFLCDKGGESMFGYQGDAGKQNIRYVCQYLQEKEGK